jgi:glycosyltransferase involved in cell wall biosynthesis
MLKNKNSNIQVSVLIPAYNAEQTISAAVDSILRGATGVRVVIAPDDGNSAKYKSIFAIHKSVVVLDATQKCGPAKTKNRAFLSAPETKWITTVDADDTVSDGFTSELLEHAARYNTNCVFAGMRYARNGATIRQLKQSDGNFTLSDFSTWFGSVRSFYTRDLWREYPDIFAEDVYVDAGKLGILSNPSPLCASAVYIANVRDEGICATSDQVAINDAYRKVLAEGPKSLVDVFASKLSIGLLYEQYLQHGGTNGFHEFVCKVSGDEVIHQLY